MDRTARTIVPVVFSILSSAIDVIEEIFIAYQEEQPRAIA
jgi:hypothetical protein